MPVPSTIADLSTVAADNSPQGSEPIGTSLDNYIRAAFAFIKQLSTGSGASGTWGISITGNAATATSASTSTTAPQFDNDTSIATTEFVQRALGNSQGVVLCNTGTTNLTAADVGKSIIMVQSGAIAALPLISTVSDGSIFRFGNGTSTGAGTVQRSGTDSIYVADSSLTSIAVYGGETLTLVKYSGGWFAIGGSVTLYKTSLTFPALLSANGYQKIPSGLLIQWGTSGAISAGGSVAVTFPVTFPKAVFSVTGSPVGATANGNAAGVGIAASVSGLTIYNWGSALAYSYGVRWMAVGY